RAAMRASDRGDPPRTGGEAEATCLCDGLRRPLDAELAAGLGETPIGRPPREAEPIRGLTEGVAFGQERQHRPLRRAEPGTSLGLCPPMLDRSHVAQVTDEPV